MDAHTFHTLIVKEFDLSGHPETEQTELIRQIGELVVQGVLSKSLATLSDDQTKMLESLLDQGKEPQDVMDYLAHTISGFSTMVQTEIEQVKKDLSQV
jgi:hypothetical protein